MGFALWISPYRHLLWCGSYLLSKRFVCYKYVCWVQWKHWSDRYKISIITCRLHHILYMLIMVTIVLVIISTVLAL